MPYSRTVRPGILCLAVSLVLLAPTAAAAATTTAQLRVVNTAGATLADQSQVTGDVTINTDPGAVCFGPPGGSGANVTVPGPSALGIVKDASNSTAALRPLSVTDQFGFGLGLCGIGGFTFSQTSTASWYLKVNHVGATVGGDQYILKAGDEVLWYLSPGFPYPNELQLVAPPVAQSGRPFTVRVFSFNDAGQRTGVSGALVTGAESPTAGDGSTTVELTNSATLQALHGADIPSNSEIVCVISAPRGCGSTLRRKIVGTNGPDRIRGSQSPDLVKARAGGDFINTRGGLSDMVNCGRGDDRAKIGSTDAVRRCEKVIRP
jgi:hypothetical protein